MDTETLLDMTAGLPYNRRIRVKDAVNVWPTLDDFEVRSHVRVTKNASSRLKADLEPFITATIDANDIVLDLNLTGAQTSTLMGGYYDIVLSDKGGADARALRVLGGQLHLSQLVTAGSDG